MKIQNTGDKKWILHSEDKQYTIGHIQKSEWLWLNNAEKKHTGVQRFQNPEGTLLPA